MTDQTNNPKQYNAEELLEIFDMLGNWEERYRFIIELGNQLPPMSDEEKNEQTKVDGCMSQVWLISELSQSDNQQTVLKLRGDSDAHIVKGLIAVLFAIFSSQPPQEILNIDIEGLFEKLGLGQHISMNRRNGFYAMVEKIRELAVLHSG